MKVTKEQLKQIIKEELGQMSHLDEDDGRGGLFGERAKAYFDSLAPEVQDALNAEFGDGGFVEMLAQGMRGDKGAPYEALDIFNSAQSKRVFGGMAGTWFLSGRAGKLQ
jgi:hypothetical protein